MRAVSLPKGLAHGFLNHEVHTSRGILVIVTQIFTLWRRLRGPWAGKFTGRATKRGHYTPRIEGGILRGKQ